jgi:anti-sigma-K factor RskA
MTDPRWSDLAGAYALDALDGEEKVAFEARLAMDAELRRLVDEYREAAASIGAAVADRSPPPALRGRVLAKAREARALADPTQVRASAPSPPAAAREARAPAEPQPDIGPGGRQSAPGSGKAETRRRSSAVPWVLLAASVAGLAYVGVANRSLRQGGEALIVEISSLRDSLARVEGERERLATLTRALTGTDVRVASLTGTVERRLWLVWNAEQNVVVVAATGLPPAQAGRTYQLWGIREGDQPVSLGTFDTAADGTAVVALAAPAGAAFEISALTDEPAGGSPLPTTTPFLAGPWRAVNE